MKCTTGKTIMTKRDAQTFINDKPEKQLRSYYCEECNHYHVTHKKYSQLSTPEIKLKHYKEWKNLLR